ncbi:hypothetical protein Lal_00014060 [Lupinus albus]|uniref:Putative NTF2-like domain-containing protein n=1 Tax=Lupinus albus TaxID=3870 RepID=A0A6A5LFU5_LUPAL|nr:putative NTF2-like domain-containing protein [Lupinus albus]KAF1861334.1 hypothetical protein Lal_00014060 [Lupinus albus]
MDALLKFPTPASCQGINSDTTKRLSLRLWSINRTCNFHLDKMQIQQLSFSSRKNVLKKSWDNNRISAIASEGDPKSGKSLFSPAETTVDQFYTCINEKKLTQLSKCVSNDAYFDDYAFTKPFQGKKEVMQFLEKLCTSMGQNVKFRVRHICEGDDFTAAANWHLEWKREQIPFTRGCTFFKLSKEGDNMIIRRAEVLIESPIKPGSIVLTLLKTMTSLFDDFPSATHWFLRSPHAVLNWILKIYNIIVPPFLNPLLDGYIKLWSFMIRLLSYAFNLAMFISNTFFK